LGRIGVAAHALARSAGLEQRIEGVARLHLVGTRQVDLDRGQDHARRMLDADVDGLGQRQIAVIGDLPGHGAHGQQCKRNRKRAAVFLHAQFSTMLHFPLPWILFVSSYEKTSSSERVVPLPVCVMWAMSAASVGRKSLDVRAKKWPPSNVRAANGPVV